MTKLLKIEAIKLKTYPVFWVILILLTFLFAASAISLANLNIKLGLFKDSADIDSSNYFKFPIVWSTFSWIAGWFSHFWSIFLIIILGNEFNYRMIRQQSIYGLNRKELFFSKFFLALLLPLVIFILIFIFSLVFGTKYTDEFSFSTMFQNFYFAIFYYIQSVTYLTFAILVVYLINTTGLSIVVYFGYMFFEGILRLLIRSKISEKIIHYFPIKSISALTPRPSIEIAISDTLQQQIMISDKTIHFNIFWTLVIPLAYFGLFLYLSYVIIKRKDL